MSRLRSASRAQDNVGQQGCDSWNAWRRVAYIVFASGLLVVTVAAAEPNEETTDVEKKTQSRIFQAMLGRAKAVRVSTVRRPDPAIKLIAEPLMHFSDPEIKILDGRLWAYCDGGRPQALMKVETHLWGGDVLPQVTWVQCFVSTSPERVDAVWASGQRFTAREPGLKLETFSNGPQPAESKAGRLTQMKALARRFSAVQVDEAKKDLEMRLLPTPIYRYADPERGIQDGAAFVFASSGTNPTLVLLVELSQPETESAKWQYSFSRMTVRQMTAKLDDRVVYEQAYTGLHPVHDSTWMWFFAGGILPEELQDGAPQ